MKFNLVGKDYANALWNDLFVIGFFTAGIAASAAVQKIAHAVFNVQNNTAGSSALRFISFAAVAITAAYHLPEVALSAFSGDKVLQMFLIAAAVNILVKIDFVRFVSLISIGGVSIGYIGNSSLVIATGLGAAIGSMG